MILLIDNYDSFVYNLRRYLMRLGQEVVVQRNDQVPVDLIESGQFEGVVISPGPQSPNEAGGCIELVQRFYTRVPILGVCLGHQVIWQALGGKITRAKTPVHGRTSSVRFIDRPIFHRIDNPFTVARYHSLVASSQSHPDLQVTGWSDDGEIMAFEHPRFPVHGWQFHPESILTQCGYQLLANFLQVARVSQKPIQLPKLDLVEGAATGDSLSTASEEPPAEDLRENPDDVPIAVLPRSSWF